MQQRQAAASENSPWGIDARRFSNGSFCKCPQGPLTRSGQRFPPMIVSQQLRQVRSVRGVPRTCMDFMPHTRMAIYRNDAISLPAA